MFVVGAYANIMIGSLFNRWSMAVLHWKTPEGYAGPSHPFYIHVAQIESVGIRQGTRNDPHLLYTTTGKQFPISPQQLAEVPQLLRQ